MKSKESFWPDIFTVAVDQEENHLSDAEKCAVIKCHVKRRQALKNCESLSVVKGPKKGPLKRTLTGEGLSENPNEGKHISRAETAVTVFKMVEYAWKDQQAILVTFIVSYFHNILV